MEVESKYIRSLLKSAQTGNNAALEQLFEMNLDRVYTLSHRLSSNQPDAEALASKTFVEAWKQLNKIRTDVPFKLWMESLNVHIALQQLSDVKEEKRRWSLFRKKKIEVKEPDSKLSPLGKEICKLPALERTVFVLHRTEKYSVDELSSMINISPDKVEKKLQNADDSLLKADFIQTSELLSKKVTELPKKVKADKKILTEALHEIYEVKLKDRVEEPEEVVEEITEEITEPVKPKPKKIKVEKEIGIEIPVITPGFKKRLWGVASVLIMAIIIYLIITSGSKDWEVIQETGTVSIDGELFTGNSHISSDETLQTEEGSSAKIVVSGVGSITVEPMTEFKRLDQKNSAALIKSTIKADFSSAEEFFTLHVPGASISEHYLGSFYTAEVRTDKNSQIFINNGWIVIKNNNREIIAPANHIIGINGTSGLQMPYHKNTDPELISAIEEFSNSGSEIQVEKIVSLSNASEVITLWNLLKRVSPGKRLLVYSKLNDIIPHPAEISKEDIINLDSEKLQIWLEQIELNM